MKPNRQSRHRDQVLSHPISSTRARYLLEVSPAITLVGEPRMGGRGLRCRKSGSLGEPRSGRQDCSPGHGWGALAWGGLKVAPRGSVGGLGSLGRTTWKSDRLGALCRRQPSPVVREECSGTEEPEDRNRDRTGCITTLRSLSQAHWKISNKALPHSRSL